MELWYNKNENWSIIKVMDAGVLLPVASLPDGQFSDGYRFVDWLFRNNYQYWQVLPIAPRDDFGSPYNSPDSMGIDPAYGTEEEWLSLKDYANRNGIKIIGDLPYFISRKEKDDLFVEGITAGAAPDYYGRRGQRWGLPVYDWENKFFENLDYLLKRVKRALELFDLIRIDHFRGYCAVWTYPARKWLPIPGEKILNCFPKGQWIAEDLGYITSEVTALRKKFGFWGMKVLVWDDPATIEADSVVYTSVHDSDTLHGHYDRIEVAKNSEARILIYAMQDILKLGSKARLNRPGRKKGNWQWRISWENIACEDSH